MALRLRAWRDDEVAIRLYVSTSGDFVALGDTTEYPFNSGGPNGNPLGWTTYDNNGGLVSEVTRSVGLGRYNIGVAGAPRAGIYYGAYKDFPVTAGKRYRIQVQAQTIQGRDPGYRTVLFQFNGTGAGYGTTLVTRSPWEQIGMFTGAVPAGTTFLRIILQGNWYTDLTGQNWGIQFQNLRLIEQQASYPNPEWEEITCETRSVGTRYGRSKVTERFDVGTMTVALLNDGGEFTYRPEHPFGLRPGRFVRATMSRPGSATEYPLFYGVLDGMSDSYTLDGHAYVNMNCVDISTLLANQTVMTSASGTTEFKSDQRIRNLAASAGWLTQMLRTQPGTFIQQTILAVQRSFREEMGLTAESEGAFFWAEPDGALAFYGRDYIRASWEQVQAEILATPYCTPPLPLTDDIPDSPALTIVEAHSLSTNWGRDRIINALMLANQGGSAFQFKDAESQKEYGPLEYQRLDLVNSNAYPDQLTVRANDFMEGNTESILRVDSVSFRPRPENYPWISKLWLNDLLRVRYELAQTTRQQWVPPTAPSAPYLSSPAGRAMNSGTSNQYTIAGDFRLRAKVRNESWNQTADQRHIAGQWTGTASTSFWMLHHGGPITFRGNNNLSTSTLTVGDVPDASTVAQFLVNSRDEYIGMEQRGYERQGIYSPDGETWQDFGNPYPLATLDREIKSGSTGTSIGAAAVTTDPVTQPFAGRIYWIEMARINVRGFTFVPGSTLSVAHAANQLITGDWSVYLRVKVNSFVGTQVLASKWVDGGSESWRVAVVGKRVRFEYRGAAGALRTITSTTDLPFNDGDTFWLQVRRQASTGQVIVATATDRWACPTTFTSNYTVTGTVENMAPAGDAPVVMGDATFQGGSILRLRVVPGLTPNNAANLAVVDITADDASLVPPMDPFDATVGGPVANAGVIVEALPDELIWRFDASEYPQDGSTSFVDARGRTWGSLTPAAMMPADPGEDGHYETITTGWGWALATHVQGIEHAITVDDWTCTLALDDPEAFTQWESSLTGQGWDEGLWDEAIWDG